MSDLKSLKPETQVRVIDESPEEKPKDEAVVEETTSESSTEEASEQETSSKTTDEKKDELADLKASIAKLNEENSSIKTAMQKRIDQLTYELKSQKEKAEKSKEKTWDDLDVAELQEYIAHYVDEGNGKMVAFLTDKLTDRKFQRMSSESTELQRNNAIRAESWSQAVDRYPELKDTNSDLYKKTLELVNSDPRYNDIKNFPEGHAVAARIASEELLYEKARNADKEKKVIEKKTRDTVIKTSLDSSTGKQTELGEGEDISRLMSAAMNSRNPYGNEWKQVLKKINSAKK